jgi:hypothetical protein|tara:strand:+ start:786 stop:1277 length:492 start_codon:yes stop_codon:yes gene_type:complete
MSTFFTRKNGIFWLNTSMSKYAEIVGILMENSRSLTLDEGELQQKLTKVEYVIPPLPQAFCEEFDLKKSDNIGIEWVQSGTELALHTDTAYGRRSNLLINVGTTIAQIKHSNNDVLETVDIAPDEHFLLNTSKLHGCENTTNDRMIFLTINWGKTYEQIQHRF